jgi:hypothetical protein
VNKRALLATAALSGELNGTTMRKTQTENELASRFLEKQPLKTTAELYELSPAGCTELTVLYRRQFTNRFISDSALT